MKTTGAFRRTGILTIDIRSPQHYAERIKNATITGYFGFVFEENSAGKSRDYRDVIVFGKLCFRNVFRPNENEKLAFWNSSGLKSVFEKLRFRDGLMWTVGVTAQIKLRFQIPST